MAKHNKNGENLGKKIFKENLKRDKLILASIASKNECNKKFPSNSEENKKCKRGIEKAYKESLKS